MRILELFSGTGSVGKIAKEKGWEVVSLDLKGADINTNILDWDYKKDYKEGDFDVIWASPPCNTFSLLRASNIGRKLKAHNGEVFTKELLENDIQTIGIPILRKAEEIIDYFKPKHWFIENPDTGQMKKYVARPFYVVDYCRYADWGYKKPTRIWTNLEGFIPKRCVCVGKHEIRLGGKGDRETMKMISLKDKYRIPPELIKDFFNLI